MKEKMTRYRVVVAAVCMVFFMTAAFAVGIGWERSHLEGKVVKAAEQEMEVQEAEKAPWYSYRGLSGETLYKNVAGDPDIVEQVCDKFSLNPDTVTVKEITREMLDFEEAFTLLKYMGDRPLLYEDIMMEATEDSMGFKTLEEYISDIYAFDKGKEVIEEVCGTHGIEPSGTMIAELTAEQLVEIGKTAYEVSDHPKD